MKRISSLFLFLLFLSACGSRNSEAQSDSDIDAARNFIRSALDGKFRDARAYMLIDSTNESYLDAAERSFRKTDPEIQRDYRAASINIHAVSPVNDSVSIIIFSNSYKQDHDTLRVMKLNNRWQVDLKYLYTHDQDTSYSHPVQTDSIHVH